MDSRLYDLRVLLVCFFQFDLVCDDAYLVDLVLSLILAASLVGTLSTGAVSDR